MNILFDLYGTLIDIHTDESKDKFWKKLAKSTKQFKDFEYLELKEEYLIICKELSKFKEEIEILDVFKQLYNVDDLNANKIALTFRKLSTKYIKKYKGVDKLLTFLKERGCKIYLLSNAQRAFTISEMEKLDLIKYFDGIAISSDYTIKKPNKDFYLKVLEQFDLAISDTWMVGNDFGCDIAPAMELGLKTIYIESNLSPNKLAIPKIEGFSYKKIVNAFKFK